MSARLLDTLRAVAACFSPQRRPPRRSWLVASHSRLSCRARLLARARRLASSTRAFQIWRGPRMGCCLRQGRLRSPRGPFRGFACLSGENGTVEGHQPKPRSALHHERAGSHGSLGFTRLRFRVRGTPPGNPHLWTDQGALFALPAVLQVGSHVASREAVIGSLNLFRLAINSRQSGRGSSLRSQDCSPRSVTPSTAVTSSPATSPYVTSRLRASAASPPRTCRPCNALSLAVARRRFCTRPPSPSAPTWPARGSGWVARSLAGLLARSFACSLVRAPSRSHLPLSFARPLARAANRPLARSLFRSLDCYSLEHSPVRLRAHSHARSDAHARHCRVCPSIRVAGHCVTHVAGPYVGGVPQRRGAPWSVGVSRHGGGAKALWDSRRPSAQAPVRSPP